MSILWFSESGCGTSFSRITDSLLPILKDSFKITLLTKQRELTPAEKDSSCGYDTILVGSDLSSMTYKEYCRETQGPYGSEELVVNMRYIILQIQDILSTREIDYLVVCNGIYEVKWITEAILGNAELILKKKTRLVVWAPIDYIPSYKIVKDVLRAHLFLTMTPVMVEEIKKLKPAAKVGYLGHGSDLHGEIPSAAFEPSSAVLKELNDLKNSFWTGSIIKEDDIIILNANNCKSERKRLDLTVKAFELLLKNVDKSLRPRLKLWIHTSLSWLKKLPIQKELSALKSNLIISNNSIRDDQLAMIYSVCKINIQTSTGEGWSLTNMEAALFYSLQVVPKFLACGYHFDDSRAIMIPVKVLNSVNENGDDVRIGIADPKVIAEKLKEAVMMIAKKDPKFIELVTNGHNYAKKFNWGDIAGELVEKLKKV